MKLLVTIILLTSLLLSVKAVDKCGGRCTSSQACGNDGRCVDISDLISCALGHYCEKGQACCSIGCMPAGEVCCPGLRYCERGHSCCGALCCIPGYVCENRKCIPESDATRKPTRQTTKSARTTRAVTRSPTRSNDFNADRDNLLRKLRSEEKKVTFQWWYGAIVSGVVLVVVIIVIFVIRYRRQSRLNAAGQPGNGGMVITGHSNRHQPQRNNMFKMEQFRGSSGRDGVVLNAPLQASRETPRPLTSVPVQTRGHQPNTPKGFVVTKAAPPMYL